MKVLHYCKSFPVREEQAQIKRYSNLRGFITNFSELTKALGASEILTWKHSNRGIRDGSDLDLINRIYGFDYQNAPHNDTYDVMIASIVRYPCGPDKEFFDDIQEMDKALAQSKSYIYFDHDRETNTYEFVRNKECQFLVWLLKQPKDIPLYTKLKVIVANSYGNSIELRERFPDKKIVYLPILDYRPNDLLVERPIDFSKKLFDFTTMKSLTDWDSVIQNTDYDKYNSDTNVLLLENTGMLRQRIAYLEQYHPKLKITAESLPLGSHINTLTNILSQVKVMTPAGNPMAEKIDLHTVKLLEACWGGCLIPIHAENPDVDRILDGMTFQYRYSKHLENLNEILDYTHSVDAATYESDVAKFRSNVKTVFNPDNWKSTFDTIASYIN